MDVNLTNAAVDYLTQLYSLQETRRINSFRIGATGGFSPDEYGTDVTGDLVYFGDYSQVKYLIVSPHEITFIIWLDDEIGDFKFGNLFLFLDPNYQLSPPIPFLWGTLQDGQSPKYKSDLPNYKVGNMCLFQFTVEFPYITSIIDLSNLEEFVAHLVQYDNEIETDIPFIHVAEYDQVIISSHTRFPGLSMAVKDTLHELWWGTHLAQYEKDPRLGQIDGGVAGIPYGFYSDVTFVDGSNYLIDNLSFDRVDGGENWALPTESLDAGSYLDLPFEE